MADAAKSGSTSGADDSKLWAVLSYFWIISILVLLMKKDSSFAQFHAKQGLVLFIVSTVGGIVLGIVPILGWMLVPFFSLAMLILGILGILNALGGKEVPLPLIGQYAEKINV